MPIRDQHFMTLALQLARRNMGQTYPNPSVGCLIVKSNQILWRGVTANSGRPHAETIALDQAGAGARGATVYVTLEPCCHYGKTPPCVDALIGAGVARIVIGSLDPNPLVAGQGAEKLRQSGIEVKTGVLGGFAARLHQGFFSHIETALPAVTLKIATSRNGYMETRGIGRRWITGEVARAHGHLLRARHDAILVGINTVLADDPMLNTRLAGQEDRAPLRVILDSALRLPIESKIAQSARRYPTVIFCQNPDKKKSRALQQLGIEILGIEKPDFMQVAKTLGKKSITSVLVEGGLKVAESALKSGLVRDIYWYRSPMAAGPGASHNILAQNPFSGYDLRHSRRLGQDTLYVYRADS